MAIFFSKSEFKQSCIESHFNLIRELIPLKKEYHARLKARNALDYDDLIIYAVYLLDEMPSLTAHVRHVLVDEFQVS